MRVAFPFCALLVAIGMVAPPPLAGQNASERPAEALGIIKKFVADMCQRPSGGGTRTTIAGKAKIEAELKGLSRLLASAGGEAGANAERVNWDGVAQEQIAKAMEAGNDCGIRITQLLLPLLLPAPVSASVSQARQDTKDGNPVRPQYASRSQYGFLDWDRGLHPTPEACVASIAEWHAKYGLTVPALSECRRLPERLACSYERSSDDPLYPVCYWTVEACESDYAIVTKQLAGRREVRLTRVGCEEVEWTAAAERYEAWRNPPPSERRRLRRVPYSLTRW